jgi:GT2 family glycosyltransferase
VAVVVVAYNDAASLRKCVAALNRLTVRPTRVIVVDNSTTAEVKAEFLTDPAVDFLDAGGNIGFSRGCNLGIARSLEHGAEYTWLLNPDTEVEPDCLAELIRAARTFPEAGVIGARIHYTSAPEKTWYAGGRLDFITGVGKHLPDLGGSLDPRLTDYVTGCSMLIPNMLLRRLGGLEERIFMYQDDAEFCMRVRAAGYSRVYAPAARMAHAVGPGMDWRLYPDYYLYFSVRNRPLVTRHPVYRAYLHAVAWALAGVKFLRYFVWPGVPQRPAKLRAIAWGAWDSLSRKSREGKRLPALFRG